MCVSLCISKICFISPPSDFPSSPSLPPSLPSSPSLPPALPSFLSLPPFLSFLPPSLLSSPSLPLPPSRPPFLSLPPPSPPSLPSPLPLLSLSLSGIVLITKQSSWDTSWFLLWATSVSSILTTRYACQSILVYQLTSLRTFEHALFWAWLL